MAITLYELAGSDPQRRFSPHCWKAHLALNHKHLDFTTVPVCYHQIRTILAFADYSLLPVLTDGDRVITDSWNIADYLEQEYPQHPLFGDAASKALAESINHWCDTQLAPLIRPLILLDIHQLLAEEDQGYFRQSREARLGQTLEVVVATAPQALAGFREELQRVRELLSLQPFLSGAAPGYADICLFGMCLWIATVNSEITFLDPEDQLLVTWYQRLLATYPDAQQAITAVRVMA